MSQATQPDSIDLLLQSGIVTAEQVEQARATAEREGLAPLRVLISEGIVSQVDMLRLGAEQAGMQFVELAEYPIAADAVARVEGSYARRHNVMPLAWTEQGSLLVAVSIKSAADLNLRDDLQRMTRSKVEFAVAVKTDITAKIDQVYRSEGELSDLSASISDADTGDDLSALTEVQEDAPIVRLVNLLITQAISDRASDIHIEPTERDLRVRYRIDGVLKETHRAPKNTQAGIISRLKIMSDINIAERRRPQDGRLSVNHQGKKIDLRVATLPTVWGEKVVMRILDNSNTRLELSDLGFSANNFKTFEKSFTKPYGMILVTGPTGSGKSTTLYATLNIVSHPTVNVITVEDPVEYRLPGINQVQVNHKAGLDFAAALRSILRSDPDIVLIGEIRDHETAQIAIEASLTGHLVLSTLHTNDAPSAVSRLIEMGIEPFLVGSALDSVLAQRLCRRLCTRCKEAYTPTAEELTDVRFPWEPGQDLPQLFRPVGCTQCSKTGYKGRMALHEVMAITESIERLTVARASSEEIMRAARANGMATLRDDGWDKVLQGHTSIEEILRVVV